MFEVLEPAHGCNTARMYRVTRLGVLIALFFSRSDAQAYIESQKKQK